MVVVHFFSRIISSWFAFALPLFRSFQALQRRPVSEPDVDRLTKYWIVIGALLAFEYSIEFLISWFPFYWELKLFFLLFVSLPQVQGSTYIYDAWLAPFLSRNELHFDHQIQLAETNFLGFFQSQMQGIFDRILGQSQASTADPVSNQGEGTGPASSIQNAARLAMGYLTAHGMSLAGRGDATRPASSRTASGTSQSAPFTSASSTSVQSSSTPDVSHRSGFVSENHASLHITPEDIYQTSSSKHNSNIATPPAFPKPEHF